MKCFFWLNIHSKKNTFTCYSYIIYVSVCVGGRLDVVFLIPATRNRSGMAESVLALLASAAGSFTYIGPRDSQVSLFHSTTWIALGTCRSRYFGYGVYRFLFLNQLQCSCYSLQFIYSLWVTDRVNEGLSFELSFERKQCFEWWDCNTRFVQMGAVVYGEDAKVGFLLNRHSNNETLLREIQSIPFNNRPGNNIGLIVPFVLNLGLFELNLGLFKWNFFYFKFTFI